MPALDVVIPTCAKDYKFLDQCIESVCRYVEDMRWVWVVSKEPPPLANVKPEYAARVRWVDEATGPATLQEIARHVGVKGPAGQRSINGVAADHGRLGWLYQQCIKLEARKWCGTELSRVHLVLDSDVVFFRRVTMVDEGVALLSWQPDYQHQPYFDHIRALTGGRVGRLDETRSGVAHHMVLDEACLDALKNVVFEACGAPLWVAFLNHIPVPTNGTDVAGGSEYELYFNFALGEFPDTHRARPLRVRDNSGFFDADDASSYKFAVNGHHHRMVGKRDIIRDAKDARDWAFGAYHRRRLDLAKFVFGMTTDEDLRTMLEADPSSAAHVLGAFGFRDDPVLRKTPAPDLAPWPWCPLDDAAA